MRPRIRHIATRFALLLAVAAVLPLVVYGLVSIVSLQRTTRATVVAGNLNVATRAAEEIRRYVTHHAELLKALASDLQNTGLAQWQQDRILKNYVLQFREFHEITLFNEDGSVVATSRIGRPHAAIPRDILVAFDGVTMSPIRVDDDLLPTTTFAIHLKHIDQPAGWLVGEFSLEQMWRMVDDIRIGDHGYALVVASNGELVAHGDPDRKALVAQGRIMSDHPLVQALAAAPDRPVSREIDDGGERRLAVGTRIAPLGWTVIVSQPTREAYANAIELRRQIVVAISIAVLVMIVLGYLLGRAFIRPIFALQRATHAVAAGHLDTRVTIASTDEFGDLASSFNTMADRLVQLQEDVKRQERHAMFGRVASGLVHDLSHPIQNIGNSARLLLRDDLDRESREQLRETIDRELASLRLFMDDLRNVVRPRPIERFPMDVNPAIAEIVEAMRPEAERHGLTVESRLAADPLVIDADRFALGRVIRNLFTNAIQATAAGGRVSIVTARTGDRVEVTVADTGSGIPAERLNTIFDEFVTTKRRGLGLGLAISKRIVEQLDGTITVESEVGRGTTFTLRFPAGRTEAQAAAS